MRGEARRAFQRLQLAGKRRQQSMLPADSEDFSHALREAFPSIRFVGIPDIHALKHRLGGAHPQPDDLSLFYCDSLAQEFELETPERDKWEMSWINAWLEPEGWEPFWIGPTPDGYHVLGNKPRMYFHYLGSRMRKRDGNEFLSEGFITSTFPRNDKEFKSFINKVWRILSKFTASVLTPIDMKRGLPYGPARTIVMGGCGLHALAWMRESPNRYVCDNCRPPEDGETGSYAPLPRF